MSSGRIALKKRQAQRKQLTTREKILGAAAVTLRERGFAGASAREIARAGDFNQALIFYHFGSVQDLLLECLSVASGARMKRYEQVLGRSGTLEAKIAAAARLYKEDLRSGHSTILSELVGASLSRPEMAPRIVEQMQPWVEFAESVVREAISGSFLEGMIDTRAAAFAIVAMYLGADLLDHLDGDHSRPGAVFEMSQRLIGWAGAMMGGSNE